jgi:hypothetical protein
MSPTSQKPIDAFFALIEATLNRPMTTPERVSAMQSWEHRSRHEAEHGARARRFAELILADEADIARAEEDRY